MSTAAVVLRHLSAAGVRHVFGYPGGANIDFIEEARREGFSLVLARREGTAAFMAEAYGMVTGLPGVCMSTLGPGSTSLVNGVANAMLDRVPMLAISGQAPEWREPYFTHQVIDHNRLFAPVTKWATRLVPASAAVTMRKALKIAMADRPGPVHLTASADAMRTPVPDEPVRLPPFRPALGLPSHPGVSEAWESVVRARASWKPPAAPWR
jgi:acetolactate synthase-1/2/3 large subunit